MKNSNAGFSLIELMVVVVILGILAAIVVPNVMDKPDQARVVKAKQDIRSLEAALDQYKLDNFKYPSTDEGLESLVSGGEKGRSYMKRLPTDPWGNEYLYLNPGINADVDIYSFGADGAEGGDDVNADIGNWNLEE